MTVRLALDEAQLDYVREMMNVAAGHSAGMLSLLLRRPVSSQIPQVRICAPHELTDFLGPPSEPSAGLRFPLLGGMPHGISGAMFFVIKESDRKQLAEMILARTPESSALEEAEIIGMVAQTVVTSHLSAIHRFCGLEFDEAPPEIVSDMLQTIIDEMIHAAANHSEILVIHNEFAVGDTRVRTHLLMIPNPESVPALVSSIDEARRRILGNSR